MSNVQFGALTLTQSKGWNNLYKVKSIFNPAEVPYQHKSVSIEITGKDVARFPILAAPTYGKGNAVATVNIYPHQSPQGTFLKVARSKSEAVGFSNVFPSNKAQFQEILTLIDETPKLSRARKYELTKNLAKQAFNALG